MAGPADIHPLPPSILPVKGPLGFHMPHPDSRLYNDAGLIRAPTQRNIFPSPFGLLHWQNWAAFSSIFAQKRMAIQNPTTHVVEHGVPII